MFQNNGKFNELNNDSREGGDISAHYVYLYWLPTSYTSTFVSFSYLFCCENNDNAKCHVILSMPNVVLLFIKNLNSIKMSTSVSSIKFIMFNLCPQVPHMMTSKLN